jgi:hypothetical protein
MVAHLRNGYRGGGGFASRALRGKNVNAIYGKKEPASAQPGASARQDYYG